MKTNIEQIENHLKSGKWIAVSFGNKKLTKTNTTIQKHNFSMEDILKESPNVETFIKSLPSKGFGNGSILQFRAKERGAIRTISESELVFADQPPQTNFQLAGPVEHQTPQPAPQMQNQYTPPAPAATQPVGAMGYTQMPVHELVSLSVMKERYAELVEQKARAEKQRDDAESALRTAKEKEASLQIRLDSIEDRHSFAIERAEADKKKFWETDTGREVVTGLAGNLPALIAALKPNSQMAQVGMGNPMPPMSPVKTQFMEIFKHISDDLIPLLESFLENVISNEAFRNEVTAHLQTLDQQNQG